MTQRGQAAGDVSRRPRRSPRPCRGHAVTTFVSLLTTGEHSSAVLISGVRVDDRLVLGLSQAVLDPGLSRKLSRAHGLASEVLELTTHERALILSTLEQPRNGLEGLRERLVADKAWQPAA